MIHPPPLSVLFPKLPILKGIQDSRGKGGQKTIVMQDPFPHQGVLKTQQQAPHSHPSGGNLFGLMGRDPGSKLVVPTNKTLHYWNL